MVPQIGIFDLVAEANEENIENTPLAERMKPTTLDEFVGQRKIMDGGIKLRQLIEHDRLSSLILHGPPGSGKTSLARVISGTTEADFLTINAVISGIKDIKEAAAKGEKNKKLFGKKTLLFIDEIHRFNKTQQDALLPYIEKGDLILVGATTENPYFSVNSALISRSMVCRLEKLEKEDIIEILKRAISSEKGLKTYGVKPEEGALEAIAEFSDGDARRALNILEASVNLKYSLAGDIVIGVEDVYAARKLTFANKADNHYDVISAFIKSMRGSDPDAAVYYLAVMLESGEDPMFIARRILICASEDVGNADPMALVVASAAVNAVHQLGLPEARIPLAQAATYIAAAPKSNAAYLAVDAALSDIREGSSIEVPYYLRDGTSISMEMRQALRQKERAGDAGEETAQGGTGEGAYGSQQGKKVDDHFCGRASHTYLYPHNYEGGYVKQRYLPEEVEGRRYYRPKDIGLERELSNRLKKLRGEGK